MLRVYKVLKINGLIAHAPSEKNTRGVMSKVQACIDRCKTEILKSDVNTIGVFRLIMKVTKTNAIINNDNMEMDSMIKNSFVE